MTADPGPAEPEIPLLGGDVTDGVVRVGDTVRRPRGPHSALVAIVLDHLAENGFDGAPRFLGVDARGRDTLTFVPGDTVARPWPDWIGADDVAMSVARLLRGYDDAVASLGIPPGAARPADPPGCPPTLAGEPELIGHLDVTPENVVFRGCAAAALIDFDLLRPATRAEEVAGLLLWWAPLADPRDRQPAMRAAEPLRRAPALVDSYGLDPEARAGLVDLLHRGARRSWHLMLHRAERDGGGWARMWADGVGEVIRRRATWLARHDAELRHALS